MLRCPPAASPLTFLLPQPPYHAEHSKNLHTFAPGSGYPVVLLVCNQTRDQNHRTSAQGEGHGGGTDIKTRMCRSHQKPQQPPSPVRSGRGWPAQGLRPLTLPLWTSVWGPCCYSGARVGWGGVLSMSPSALPSNCVNLVENR